MLKIDPDVPLPPAGHRGRRAVYPWAQMRPGDSFAVPVPTGEHPGAVVSRLFRSFYQWRRKSADRRELTIACRHVPGPAVRAWLQSPAWILAGNATGIPEIDTDRGFRLEDAAPDE